MRTRLARRLILPMLALTLLGSGGAVSVAAQVVTGQTQTTSVNRTNSTVTVVTFTTYSDGTWSRVVETWSYRDEVATKSEL